MFASKRTWDRYKTCENSYDLHNYGKKTPLTLHDVTNAITTATITGITLLTLSTAHQRESSERPRRNNATNR